MDKIIGNVLNVKVKVLLVNGIRLSGTTDKIIRKKVKFENKGQIGRSGKMKYNIVAGNLFKLFCYFHTAVKKVVITINQSV